MRIFPTNNQASLIKMQSRKPDSSHGGLGVHQTPPVTPLLQFHHPELDQTKIVPTRSPMWAHKCAKSPIANSSFLRLFKMECSRCDSRDSVLGCTAIPISFVMGYNNPRHFWPHNLSSSSSQTRFRGGECQHLAGCFWEEFRWQVLDRKGGFKSNVQQSTFNTLIFFNWGTLFASIAELLKLVGTNFFSAECLCFWW